MRSTAHGVSRSFSTGLAFLALCASAFCQVEGTVARIGDRTLSVEQFEAMARELRKTGYSHIEVLDEQSKRELLEGIIARELLVAEGIRRGYDREPNIALAVEKTQRRALIKELYEREAVQVSYSFTEAELRTFFVERQYDTEVLSQHIVCETDAIARQVLAALQGGAPFESLVRLYSVPSIQNRFGPGGWVGWFKVGEVFEELREPMSAMEPGSVYPEPVKTAIGYHVFRLKSRRPVDFGASREWIEEQMLVHSRAADMERYVEKLRQRYNLVLDTGVFAALRKVPAQATTWTGVDRPLFTWRGGQLTARDYMEQVGWGSARHPATLDSAGLHRDADNLAGKQIMMAEARKLGLADEERIRKLVEEERNRLLVGRIYQVETEKRARKIGDDEVRAFYERHLEEFTREDGKITEFSFIQESIRTALQERDRSRAMDAFLSELRRANEDRIEIFPAGLDRAFASKRSP